MRRRRWPLGLTIALVSQAAGVAACSQRASETRESTASATVRSAREQGAGRIRTDTTEVRRDVAVLRRGSGLLEPFPVSRTTLQVRLNSKEFEEWGSRMSIYGPREVYLLWATDEPDAARGMWQLADRRFSAKRLDAEGLLAWGFLWPVPPSGKHALFSIDLEPFLPASPRPDPQEYFVRVVPMGAWRSGLMTTVRSVGDPVGAPSSSVILKYMRQEQGGVFLGTPEDRDIDEDGLRDRLEYTLAERFRPLFRFDSSEAHRRPNEPVVLYQVRPDSCVGRGCGRPQRVLIRYALLFAEDGGYGPSSACRNRHNGDAQTVELQIELELDGASANPLLWKVLEVRNGQFTWPGESAEIWYHKHYRKPSHPVIFLSAHKHHQYFNTYNDEKDSVYSNWGCNDDVNGQGARILAHVLSPEGKPNNVGEPEAHAADSFVGDLSVYGYPGENAWSDRPFKGGLGDDGGETSSMRSLWMSHRFDVKN